MKKQILIIPIVIIVICIVIIKINKEENDYYSYLQNNNYYLLTSKLDDKEIDKIINVKEYEIEDINIYKSSLLLECNFYIYVESDNIDKIKIYLDTYFEEKYNNNPRLLANYNKRYYVDNNDKLYYFVGADSKEAYNLIKKM